MNHKKLYVGYNKTRLFEKENSRKKIGKFIISCNENETEKFENRFSVEKIENKIVFYPALSFEILSFIHNKDNFEIKKCNLDELKLEVEALKEFQEEQEIGYASVYKKEENPNALITASILTLFGQLLSRLEEKN
ncbi:hypothetical protein [Fusobacterium necrophorum]|uniref:hypothetical protein n=1 Tax=Fusobacterium necrophorum TaxID=859 RepID=UPI00370F31AD